MNNTALNPAQAVSSPPAAVAGSGGGTSRQRLLDAALRVIRSKGYSATTVDDICHEAGVTKGSFFHHFKSKDALALAAVAYWREFTEGFFAGAPYHAPRDPVARLLGYIEFRGGILAGDLPNYTCLLGTLVQETYDTHPEIRTACEQALASHVGELTRDLAAAKELYAPHADWTPQSAGNFIQAVLQGSFIFAKAQQGPEVIRESLAHLRRYLLSLFPGYSTGSVSLHAGVATAEPVHEDESSHNHQSHYTD
jgi:TetR/AcrR family transcriptional repressor of nem operon